MAIGLTVCVYIIVFGLPFYCFTTLLRTRATERLIYFLPNILLEEAEDDEREKVRKVVAILIYKTKLI